jgi:phage N-6-adenine-methyltransferase
MSAYMPLALTDDWATPQALFDEWDSVFGFDLDAAASSSNYKCANWYGLDNPDSAKRDALSIEWQGNAVWLNPPYGRVLNQWVKKAYDSNLLVVMLLPARTDTRWFHTYCLDQKITFIKGRVKFGNGTAGAPFPSMIVVMRPR